MRKLVLLAVLAIGSFAVKAQTPATTATKIGYADVDYIFGKMPDSKRIDAELKSLQTQLKNNIDAKVQEFQKKLGDYNEALKNNTMPDAIRANTERELQQLQQNIEKLQQEAQTNLQNKQLALMEPVYKTVGEAIEAVAKENGYTLILNSIVGGIDVVLYGDASNNISDLVLKKLGVTVTATTTTDKPKQN